MPNCSAKDVTSVELTGDIKRVMVHESTYLARSVILAMGAQPRYLNVPGEQELLGRGVSSCATCDGFFFRDQDIAVIGGGDSAMEEATFLTKFARVGDRGASTRRVPRLEDHARARPGQRQDPLATGVTVDRVTGDGGVSGLELSDGDDAGGHWHVRGDRARPAQSSWSAASWTPTQPATYWSRHRPRLPASTAYSRAATWWTTRTGKPSPPRVPDARPRSTPNVGSLSMPGPACSGGCRVRRRWLRCHILISHSIPRADHTRTTPTTRRTTHRR